MTLAPPVAPSAVDLLPLHATHAEPPGLTVRLVVGLAAGLLAAVVANVPMGRLREGQTPPFVAARALTGDPLPEVSAGLATGLHYATGALGGLLFALVGFGLERVLPTAPALPGVVLPVYPSVAALGLVALSGFGLVASVLLPRFGGSARDRAARVRRDWAVVVAVYAVALGVAVPALLLLLR